MPKKKTKVSNVNTNVNNIHVNIHSKKKKSKASKTKSSVQPFPNIINVSVAPPPFIPQYNSTNHDPLPREQPRGVFEKVNPLNTVGFEPVRPIPVEMNTQTDLAGYSVASMERDAMKFADIERKREMENLKRRERRKAEKVAMDSFEYKSA